MHYSDEEIMDLDNGMDYDDMPYDPLQRRSADDLSMDEEDLDQYLSEQVNATLSESALDEDAVNADLWEDSPIDDDDDSMTYNRKQSQKMSGSGKLPRQKHAARSISILAGILAITALCSLGLCLYMLFNHSEPAFSNSITENKEDAPVFYSQEEVDILMEEAALAHEQELKNEIMNQLSSENPSVNDTLRWLYSDDFVLYQDSGSYHFVPISDTIERNTLERGNLSVSENGEISYTSQNGTSARKGIDVSQHQGDIDWEQVAASGVEFAIIRAGIRGYGTGALVTDEYFEHNMEGAAANGIDIGVYFFTQAITVEEALAEAQYVLELIAPYDITYPIVIDVENPSSDARANVLTQAQRTEIVSAFCDAIAEAGYTPMIYGGTYSLFGMLDIEQINHYKIWFAFYNDYIYYPYQMQMWQYSDKGSVPGIEGAVDLNLWFLE
ncbi:MAG: glycoside hydrolase family 25 protein [Lachnospiraceae bacterium]|nr:glycoside hydrolase family 25 protein [Lachnospiraceae bacterium]